MSYSKNTPPPIPQIRHLLKIRERLEHIKKDIAEQRKAEKELIREVQNYLIETGRDGVRIDNTSVIKLEKRGRKIPLSKTKYEERTRELLASRGINDEEFRKSLVNKTKDIIHTQKCIVAPRMRQVPK